ncbi:MAG TPA: hypothetical protein VN764_01255, partial [Polyangiaceae bacterium]|nr:hypothetical protein [Polyangiaceae bacterium]
MRRFALRAPWSAVLVLTVAMAGAVSCGARTPLSDLDAWDRDTGGGQGYGDGDGDTSEDGVGGSVEAGGSGGSVASGGSGGSGGVGALGGSGGAVDGPEYLDELGAPCKTDGARAC